MIDERYMQESAARHRTEALAEARARGEGAGPDPNPPPFRPSRLRRYRELLVNKARALIDRGSIGIQTNGEPLLARIHRFPDGTAVLESEYRSPYGRSHDATRIDPDRLDPEVIAKLLENALLNARVRPIAGQPT